MLLLGRVVASRMLIPSTGANQRSRETVFQRERRL